MRTIVIDENASVCAAITIMLEEWKHDVVPTCTLLEAVHKLSCSKYSPDVIIINVPYYHYETNVKNIDFLFSVLGMIFPSSGVIVTTEEFNGALNISANKHGWVMLVKPFSEEALRGALLMATSKPKTLSSH